MTAIVNCPSCSIPIGRIDCHGLFRGVCVSCQLRYGLVCGQLLGISSQQNPVYSGNANSADSDRQYEFRIKTIQRRVETFSVSTSARYDGSPIIMGKTVYVVTKLTTVGYGAD
jgi:hypothetical protein